MLSSSESSRQEAYLPSHTPESPYQPAIFETKALLADRLARLREVMGFVRANGLIERVRFSTFRQAQLLIFRSVKLGADACPAMRRKLKAR